jgi:NAD(P)-dependent dehydrogenase (short-subunit alcohol dehydrogenase family)
MASGKAVIATGESEGIDVAIVQVFLESGHVTGEVLHVDDGAHVGRW